MSAEILERICSELTNVMGPLAPVVMGDKLKGMDCSWESFPIDRIAQLVEVLSYEIQDEAGRAEFQKGALKQLRHAGTYVGA